MGGKLSQCKDEKNIVATIPADDNGFKWYGFHLLSSKCSVAQYGGKQLMSYVKVLNFPMIALIVLVGLVIIRLLFEHYRNNAAVLIPQ